MCPKMIPGIAVRKKQPNHDKIDNTRLQIASGSVRDADDAGAGAGGWSAIAPF